MNNYIKSKLGKFKYFFKNKEEDTYVNKIEEEKVQNRFIESPFMSDFSTYFFNCRRNLISFSLFILFYYIYGEKIFGNSDLKVFNLSISKSNIEEIKPAILIILCYFILHFTYLAVNYIRENIIRVTGEKPEYAKLLKLKLLKDGVDSDIDKLEPEKQINVGALVSALVEHDNIFLNETERKVLPKSHILKSLKFLKCILQEVHINLEDIKTIHKTVASLKDKKSKDLYGEVGGFRSINNVGKNIFYMSNNDILMNIDNPDVISTIINTYNDISYSKDIISNVESENNSLKNMFKEYLDIIKEDIQDLKERDIENNKLREEYNLEIINLYELLLRNLDINIKSLGNSIDVIKKEIGRLIEKLNDINPNLKGVYIDKRSNIKRKTY